MSKISDAFQNKKAFVGFLTAGDPSLDKTEEFIITMEKAGASVIEIGVPFSDPIAEGPVVQEANVRALSVEGGCTTDMIFNMLARVKDKVSVPIVLMTYLNPVFKFGYDAFLAKCQETGVSGIIIPDMPYDEKGEILPFAEKYGIDIISLVAPASKSRIQMIAKEAKGYIYVLPSLNATDARNDIVTDISGIVAEIRQVTDTPVILEIGVNYPEAEYETIADGFVVENAIVNIIEKHGNDAAQPIYDYVKKTVESL
ncbi:MAG: tryptophan synthase subunit alpha [Lachnospiraceae bacterium]|nr:tryptophan synthase subunit alpha [Lachnospiraceae bacterium]